MQPPNKAHTPTQDKIKRRKRKTEILASMPNVGELILVTQKAGSVRQQPADLIHRNDNLKSFVAHQASQKLVAAPRHR